MSRRTLSLRSALRARAQRAGGGVAGPTGLSIVNTSMILENVLADGTLLVPIPDGTADGHYMVLFLGRQNDIAITNALGLASWTEIVALRELNNFGDDFHTSIWVKTASSEGATVAVKNPHAAQGRPHGGIIVTLQSVHADGFDVTPIGTHSEVIMGGINEACPAITSLTDEAIMLNMHFHYSGMTAFGAPAGYLLQQSDFSILGCQMGLATKKLGAAGLETPGVWTNAGVVEEGARVSFLVKQA